jgi:15-cis-phytoene synthase
MQDTSDYCAELVRAADRDRYIATLFAPAELRGALHGLYAFNIEVARVREAAREPLPGEIRLQWWRDVVNGERGGEASANPVAAALLAAVAHHRISIAKLNALLDASRFDLYDEPMARLADLEAYARNTGSTLIALAAQILAGANASLTEMIAGHAGMASAITAVLRTFPLHAARGQLYVPIELLSRHGAVPQEIFAGRSSAGLNSALAELREIARRHLVATQQHLSGLPREALPAFLPLALVRPSLDRLERCDAFAPAEISPWRRQWLIWRAARKPARLTS